MQNNNAFMVQYLFRQVRKNLEKLYDQREAGYLARILFDHFAQLDIKSIITNPALEVSSPTVSLINAAVSRLLDHEPVQYITGFAHFCGNEFRVNPKVLIPRPETEELVRWILDDHSTGSNLFIADIGTGGGCIAISIGLRLNDATIFAYDISEEALQIAKKNNAELQAGVHFHKVDFLNPMEWPAQKFDIIVSNPPYIPEKLKSSLPLNVSRFEPAEALFIPDQDPLIFYRNITDFARQQLKPQGSLYFEVHEYFADEVVQLLQTSGFCDVKLRHDLNGKKRMVKGRLEG